MKKKSEKHHHSFDTRASRSQMGTNRWTPSVKGFPKIGNMMKGCAVKESIVELKIESKTVSFCDARERPKNIRCQAKGEVNSLSRGMPSRDLPVSRQFPQGNFKHGHRTQNTQRRSEKTGHHQQTSNAHPSTVRHKAIDKKGDSLKYGNGKSKTNSKSNGGMVNRNIPSVVLGPPEQQDSNNHLPPLNISKVDTQKGSTYSKLLALVEKRKFGFQSKTRLDWQRLLETRGGFRPNDAREIPTAGEVALLRFKTWGKDAEPICRIQKYAKYLGLAEQDKAKGDRVTYTRSQHYADHKLTSLKTEALRSPLTVMYNLNCISKGPESSRAQAFYRQPSPTPPLLRWNYSACVCIAPPVTPSSPLLPSSPTLLGRPQSLIGGQSTLEDIEETETDFGFDKDEGIGTPSTEESIDDLSYFI